MIAYYPLEELDPPKQEQLETAEIKNDDIKNSFEESELNYVVIAFIVGVIALAISDTIRA
jgi:hypothetical protein